MHAPLNGRDHGLGDASSQGADAVVLVHCSASSSRQWDALTAQLAGFRVVALDLYGHGRRQRWRGEGPLTLCDEAAIIPAALREGERIHLVGHSYGGAVALRFALDHPERLQSLTLIEPSAFHVLSNATDAQARARHEIESFAGSISDAVLRGDYHGGMQVFIDYWGGAGSWRGLPDERKSQFANLAICIAHHFAAAIGDATTLAACSDITAPTLVLCGSDSPTPAKLIARLLADTIPQARHRTIDNAGHMSPITHPTQVNPLILDHLRRHCADCTPPFGSRQFTVLRGAAVRMS